MAKSNIPTFDASATGVVVASVLSTTSATAVFASVSLSMSMVDVVLLVKLVVCNGRNDVLILLFVLFERRYEYLLDVSGCYRFKFVIFMIFYDNLVSRKKKNKCTNMRNNSVRLDALVYGVEY